MHCGLIRNISPFIFFLQRKKRNNFASKRVINQTSFSLFIFFLQRKKNETKKRRRCISELYGKFIVLKTKIQKLASLKQSEFFNVFLTIFSYSEIRRRINNKVFCADVCYLLLVVVCSNGVFFTTFVNLLPR